MTFEDDDLGRWSHLVGRVPADLGLISGDCPMPVEVVQWVSGLTVEPLRVDSPKIRVGEVHLDPGAAVLLARILTDAVALLDEHTTT